MKIQYASDLHLEIGDNSTFLKKNPIIPVGDILVLAGDIGYLNDEHTISNPFWDYVSIHFKQVVVLVGNHELYKWYDLAQLPQGLVGSIRENVKYYNNAVLRFDDVELILSTLWARIPLEEAYTTENWVSDFRRILYQEESFTFDKFNKEHERCFRFIQNAVRNSSAKHVVVITHHVPSFQLSSPDFAGSRINGAFTVELESFIKSSSIDYWIYGHSHRNIDKVIGKTKCVSNQLGYVSHNEHLSFDAHKIIEI